MSNYVLILTEGESEEVFAIHSLNNTFLKDEKMHIISFKTNIYSLYSQLKKDDFDTDLVEVLKERNAGKDILCGKISIRDGGTVLLSHSIKFNIQKNAIHSTSVWYFVI